MLANLSYGNNWKKDLEAMGGKDGMRDPRYKVVHNGEDRSVVTIDAGKRALRGRGSRPELHTAHPWN